MLASKNWSKVAQCQQASKNPSKQEPVPWPQTNSPWTSVHMDFTGPINGVTYLVIDSLSKYPEVISFTSATTTAIITALRSIFSQHDLPEIVVLDKCTQFTLDQFNKCYHQHCIKHIILFRKDKLNASLTHSKEHSSKLVGREHQTAQPQQSVTKPPVSCGSFNGL